VTHASRRPSVDPCPARLARRTVDRVRDSGVLDERDPLTDADHVCWVDDDSASLVTFAGVVR
jgi:hypothetical protein